MQEFMKPALLALAVAGMAVTACSGSPHHAVSHAGPVRYSSAQQMVAALGKAGMPCAGAEYSSPPVVSGATSEASCTLGSSDHVLIDVFSGNITNATVVANSQSTGTEQIFSAVGLNWWVQANQPDAQQIKKKLGGRAVIAGPWIPPAAAQPSADNALACSTVIDDTGWKNGPLTELRAIAILSDYMTQRALPIIGGTLDDSELTVMGGLATDMENYSGSNLSDNASQYASDEQSYAQPGPSGDPENTAFATPMMKDILLLVKDCPGAYSLGKQMLQNGS